MRSPLPASHSRAAASQTLGLFKVLRRQDLDPDLSGERALCDRHACKYIALCLSQTFSQWPLASSWLPLACSASPLRRFFSEFGRSLQSTGGLYFVAVLRIAFGIILLWAAADARTPVMMRVLGVLILVAGVATPFLGVERSPRHVRLVGDPGHLSRAPRGPVRPLCLTSFIAYSNMPRGSGM